MNVTTPQMHKKKPKNVNWTWNAQQNNPECASASGKSQGGDPPS